MFEISMDQYGVEQAIREYIERRLAPGVPIGKIEWVDDGEVMISINLEHPVESRTFTLRLLSAGEKKINVIKETRALTGLGLKEAKDLVEDAPRILRVFNDMRAASTAAEAFEAQGATVEVI